MQTFIRRKKKLIVVADVVAHAYITRSPKTSRKARYIYFSDR